MDMDAFNQIQHHVNVSESTLAGLLEVLDSMYEEIARDQRGYALIAVLENVKQHLEQASDLLDEMDSQEQ